eukprot:755141-Hanusia_phi.AAC.1
MTRFYAQLLLNGHCAGGPRVWNRVCRVSVLAAAASNGSTVARLSQALQVLKPFNVLRLRGPGHAVRRPLPGAV